MARTMLGAASSPCTFAAPESYAFRRLLIRMYWDEEETPSVEAPIGDFFGVGHGVASHYVSLPLNMITRQDGPQPFAAMNCFFQMPFLRRGRVTIVNQCASEVPNFYFYVDYRALERAPEAGVSVTAGFQFDTPVRFDSDRIETTLESFEAGRMAAVPLIEVRV